MNYTVLVNKNNKFRDSYLKRIELVECTSIDNKKILIEKETYLAYQELKKTLMKNNIEIGIKDGYRDLETQQKLWEEGSNLVAEPSFSEHHTGLAIDIMRKEKGVFTKNNLEDVFPFLKDYGFILSYPDKSWHLRYVGKIPARIMADNNLNLEEYLSSYGAILYVNKPKGITSFDVVNEIRKAFGINRVGHTGTLDPMATGVLIVAIGKATKIVELLTAEDKEYIAGVKLGIETDTYDITGKILSKKEVNNDIDLENVIKSYKKTYMQEVPIYSAVKVKGKKLYEYARDGKDIDLPKKEVTIKEIELLSQGNDNFTFSAKVTKGCYIRSLIHDIGISLNTYATMTSLERIKQGKVTIEETDSLENIKNGIFTLHKIEEVLDYPIIKVDSFLEKKIRNGMKLDNTWDINDKVIFKTKDNTLLGIYEKKDSCLQVYKNFC